MYIGYQNGREAFLNFIDTLNVEFDPHDRWLCAHVRDGALQRMMADDERIATARVTMDAYFDDLKVQFFFGPNSEFYMFSKSCKPDVLEALAYDVCDLLLHGNPTSTSVNIYSFQYKKAAPAQGRIEPETAYEPLITSVSHHGNNISEYNRETFEALYGFENYQSSKILLIEDDLLTRTLMRSVVEQRCRIESAANMRDGLLMFRKFKPDITFLDVGLPDGDGHDALAAILRQDPNAHVIMCTGRDNPQSRVRATTLGAKGFLAKPFVKEDLINHIYERPNHMVV